MKRKSNVTRCDNYQNNKQDGLEITDIRGWLNPTKCTLRWLGLQPTRLQHGEKTCSIRLDDKAA